MCHLRKALTRAVNAWRRRTNPKINSMGGLQIICNPARLSAVARCGPQWVGVFTEELTPRRQKPNDTLYYNRACCSGSHNKPVLSTK
jgi:hypothetical protein